MKVWLLLVAVVLLAGCGGGTGPEIVRYGRDGSVNGFAVLRGLIEDRYHLSHRGVLGSEDLPADVIIHIDQDGDLAQADAFWERLEEWLSDDDGRQAVVVLRDLDVTRFICGRWSQEARAAAVVSETTGDEAMASQLRAAAESFDRLAAEERLVPPLGRGQNEHFTPHLLHIELGRRGVAAAIPKRLEGSGGFTGMTAVPQSLEVSAVLVSSWGDPTVLLRSDLGALVASYEVQGSRLIVVSSGAFLTDGAVVDPAARDLMAGLLAEIQTFHPEDVVWLRSAGVGVEEFDPPPTVLALMMKPPFGVVFGHGLALLVIWLLWRSSWLGRREAVQDRSRRRFRRHLEALGRQLAARGGSATAMEALANWHHREAPRSGAEPDQQLATVRAWWRDDEAQSDSDHATAVDGQPDPRNKR